MKTNNNIENAGIENTDIEKDLLDLKKEFNGEYGIEPVEEEKIMEGNQVLIYDLVSVPTSSMLNVDAVMSILKRHNVLFWDSYLGGKEPKIINAPENCEIKIIDTSSEEGKEFIKNNPEVTYEV